MHWTYDEPTKHDLLAWPPSIWFQKSTKRIQRLEMHKSNFVDLNLYLKFFGGGWPIFVPSVRSKAIPNTRKA